MIYWELFSSFFKVGLFAFGGAYGAIPLIRDAVLAHGWLSDETLSYMIAVSESTPGPIMVNLATYVGSSQAGLPGALLATGAVVLPAFCIILLIAMLLHTFLKNRWVQGALKGMKPCVVGIVLATGLYIAFRNCVPSLSPPGIDWRACLIMAILLLCVWLWPRLRKKALPPITMILISACLGMIVYAL